MNVYEFILSNWKNGLFTNYGSLTSWIGCDNPRYVADYFTEIDRYFIENNMPPFSTLIINQTMNMPDDGYFNYHFPSIWHQFELNEDELESDENDIATSESNGDNEVESH